MTKTCDYVVGLGGKTSIPGGVKNAAQHRIWYNLQAWGILLWQFLIDMGIAWLKKDNLALMLMPASSEFIALCRSQVTLLSQVLGAALSVVYLTDELIEDEQAKLIPIVVYPDSDVVWQDDQYLGLLPAQKFIIEPVRGLLAEAKASDSAETRRSLPSEESLTDGNPSDRGNATESQTLSRQLVLPLIHEDVVIGLLVTNRPDRPWNRGEVTQIERIANTLAIARILDRRGGWFQKQLRQKQLIQSEQNDLLDNLLHQLRSPLTAMRTFGKLLLKRLQGEDPNRQIATNILTQSDRIQELLSQMDRAIDLNTQEQIHPLELMDAPENPIQKAEDATDSQATRPATMRLLPPSSIEICSVAEVLEPLLISAQAIAEEKQLSCHLELPENLPPVRANPKALREVLSNLIDNALKYTSAGGYIDIQVKYSDLPTPESNFSSPPIAIAVSDTGLGIPEADLDHLFERHYRGVQANSDIPGTGLGLAIVRELLDEMHADIEVFSPAPSHWLQRDRSPSSNPGTTFVIWLATAIA